MTRINSAISVKNLTDEHLLAEHREIKRLPNWLLTSIKWRTVPRIPDTFTLGEGHVRFFYGKMAFTLKRFKEIHAECLERGFNVTDYSGNWDDLKNNYGNLLYWKDYIPTVAEHTMLVKRITERIRDGKKTTYHYYGKPITREQAIELLNK